MEVSSAVTHSEGFRMTSAQVSQKDRPELAQFTRYLNDRAELDREFSGADELSANQMETILRANSEDALWTAMENAGVPALRDLDDGTEIQINGFRILAGNNQEFSNRFGVYVIIEAQSLESGQEMQLNTGVERVIGFLRMVESEQAGIKFPVEVRVKKTTTGSGNTLVTFARVPKRAVRVKTA